MPLVPATSVGGGSSDLLGGQVVLTSGNLTTTSNSFVDATGLTVTFQPTAAHRVLVSYSGSMACTATGSVCCYDVAVDGSRQGGSLGLVDINEATANLDQNASFTFVTAVLTAASHTIKLQFRSNGAATHTIFASATSPAVFSVVELPLST